MNGNLCSPPKSRPIPNASPNRNTPGVVHYRRSIQNWACIHTLPDALERFTMPKIRYRYVNKAKGRTTRGSRSSGLKETYSEYEQDVLLL